MLLTDSHNTFIHYSQRHIPNPFYVGAVNSVGYWYMMHVFQSFFQKRMELIFIPIEIILSPCWNIDVAADKPLQ